MSEGLAFFSCEPWHVLGKYTFYKYKETPLLALLFQRIIFEEQSFNCTIFHSHFIKNESYFPKSIKHIHLIIESVFEAFQRTLKSFKNGCWTERNSESKFGWLSKSTSWLLQDFFPTKLLEKIMLTWPEKFFVEFCRNLWGFLAKNWKIFEKLFPFVKLNILKINISFSKMDSLDLLKEFKFSDLFPIPKNSENSGFTKENIFILEYFFPAYES